jgi:5-methylcytosine-specific restriction endonuclease McrA
MTDDTEQNTDHRVRRSRGKEQTMLEYIDETMTRERLTELQTMPYKVYLKTPEWLFRKTDAIVRAEYRCQICYSPDKLNVHHRTYDRIGQERPGDLTVLCKECHELFHFRLGLFVKERNAQYEDE